MELTDVTVREAAQMPGRSYGVERRVDAALAIDRLGVDRIQTGFPITGDVDREVTRRVSERADAETVAIARARTGDVDAALESNVDVVEVFAPVSPLHLEHELGKSREEVLEMLREAVDHAHDGGATVRIGVLDAFRTDLDDLATVFDRFPDVFRIGLADTVGARAPKTVRSILGDLETEHGVDLERVGVHFHNDLGVGVANVLAAYECGVGNADVSIAALGERVGNPALEELVAVGDLEYDEAIGVDTGELIPVANEVLDHLGESVSDRKPILGSEAVTHEVGIHTAVMLDHPSAYEPFDPSRFGGRRVLVFGEGTGRTGARKLLERADIEPTQETISTFLNLLAERGPADQDEATELARRELS